MYIIGLVRNQNGTGAEINATRNCWRPAVVSGSLQIYVSFSVFTWLLNVIGFHTRGRTPYQTTEKHFSFHRSIVGLKLQELHFAEVNRPVRTSLIDFERA